LNLFLSTDPNGIPSFCALDISKLPPVSYNYVDMSVLLKDIENLRLSVDILKSAQAEMLCAMHRLCTLPPQINSNTVHSDIVLTENSSAIRGYSTTNHELISQPCKSTRNIPESSRSTERTVESITHEDMQYTDPNSNETLVSVTKTCSALWDKTA
jgi:hypothetical protein